MAVRGIPSSEPAAVGVKCFCSAGLLRKKQGIQRSRSCIGVRARLYCGASYALGLTPHWRNCSRIVESLYCQP